MAEATVVQAIRTEVGKFADSSADEQQKVMSLAALSVLLPQLGDSDIPNVLRKQVDVIEAMLASEDSSTVKNACAVLTGVITFDEEQWKKLAVKGQLVPSIVRLLSAALSAPQPDTGLQINLVAGLIAAAQGGEQGAEVVLSSGGLEPILCTCSPSHPPAVQEAGADAVCQLASYEGATREALSAAGAVERMAGLLATDSHEVRVRALMALGMLLPGSDANQQALASNTEAVCNIMACTQQDEDMDVKVIARDLFVGLAQNCKEAVAAALRAGQAAAAAAAAAGTEAAPSAA
mmetsp:Transcript_26430/g.57654  ORF Transcript_26430/g.57654 Transcript_26430/m.57654 type:complete len:292 (-) Transcript_26430:130-1005(-)|eukprot:CAMPEP_0202904874 /NCGR_PEP_ID=MMETSP1392-20130828/31556_1 /ASSEMBLY_ACC=CAM_ASM_000868 /TAXON_ID=225041 /ORGANISM="Chlamydomonas chlamydogama, Strain SAG 11-48b" /LENGTH=291 /DNA_ID=CAMNT_0049592727 /DNA_START=36 /DNA_END=914 /DNA_ORIENTATION=+